MKSLLPPESNLFRLLKRNLDIIAGIIYNPLDYTGWSLQGFGMLRLYLTPDIRLHIWDTSRQAYPPPSLIHDHPWDFRSIILAGELRNRRYSRSHHFPETFEVFNYATIKCGPGGGITNNPTERCILKVLPDEIYRPGDQYEQLGAEIHASWPGTGCVTLVERYKSDDPDHAHVFWPTNERWITAEPHLATADDVLDICGKVNLPGDL